MSRWLKPGRYFRLVFMWLIVTHEPFPGACYRVTPGDKHPRYGATSPSVRVLVTTR